jgi:hypothetical protein
VRWEEEKKVTLTVTKAQSRTFFGLAVTKAEPKRKDPRTLMTVSTGTLADVAA